MKTVMVKEDQFFEFHEDIKGWGIHIIRCIQVDGDIRHGKYYLVTVKADV
jgi:hypothetical protein